MAGTELSNIELTLYVDTSGATFLEFLKVFSASESPDKIVFIYLTGISNCVKECAGKL